MLPVTWDWGVVFSPLANTKYGKYHFLYLKKIETDNYTFFKDCIVLYVYWLYTMIFKIIRDTNYFHRHKLQYELNRIKSNTVCVNTQIVDKISNITL